MSDERLEQVVSSWLKGTAALPPDPAQSAKAVVSHLPGAMARPGAGRLGPVASAFGLAASLVLLAVVGGILVIGLPDARQAPTPGSSGGDGPAIHWAANVVDLRADAMELRIGDKVFTAEGADVVVDGSGYQGQFGLTAEWQEDGQMLGLHLDFTSNGKRWAANGPSLRLEGVTIPNDTMVDRVMRAGADGEFETRPRIFGDHVDFDGSDWIRRPLGETYEGDWRLEGRMEMPVCGPEALETVDVTLTFEGARLSVEPRGPSLIEQLDMDWFHPGSLLSDIFHGERADPQPRMLECPALGDPGLEAPGDQGTARRGA